MIHQNDWIKDHVYFIHLNISFTEKHLTKLFLLNLPVQFFQKLLLTFTINKAGVCYEKTTINCNSLFIPYPGS